MQDARGQEYFALERSLSLYEMEVSGFVTQHQALEIVRQQMPVLCPLDRYTALSIGSL